MRLRRPAHAFLPFLFEKTASTIIRRLHARVTSRQPRPASAASAADRLLGWDPVI
jgi:hypothetical protein